MKRRIRDEQLALLVNGSALVAVLVAIALGATSPRLWRTACFLILGTAASGYIEAVVHLSGRRAVRQRDFEIPRGVRLRRPLWLSVDVPLFVLALASLLAAVAAAVGFTGAGAGILIVAGVIGLMIGVLSSWWSPDGVTFEVSGLRVHLLGVSFLVPWDAITDVERGGEAGQLVYVRVIAVGVIRAVEPNTPPAWERARVVVSDGDLPTGILHLDRWTGGLDTAVLARAIATAAKHTTARTN